MKFIATSSILLAVACLATPLTAAEQRGAATKGRYDLYQVSIQARHCKLKVSVNGVISEDLSLDATHGGAVSAPMSKQDLKSNNTITIQVEASDADPTVSLNVVGITREREVVSTDEPGNVASLNLDAKQIAAAKGKRFSVRFKANFRKAKPEAKPPTAISETVSEEEARAYGEYLSGLFRKKDKAKLIEELMPMFSRFPEAKGLPASEVRQRGTDEMTGLLDNHVFLEDKGLPLEVKRQDSEKGPSYELRAKGSQGLFQFYAKADPEKKPRTMMVLIVKIQGKLQVAELGTM